MDSLPQGAKWICEVFEATSDERDYKGQRKVVRFELWKRNPVDCIKELLSDPQFKEHLCYAPERLYEDAMGEKPIFSEMWSGEWWEKLQVSVQKSSQNSRKALMNMQKLLPKGATLVSIILASDKTQLSAFSGNKYA